LGKWVKKARDSGRVPEKDLSESERAELERLRTENGSCEWSVTSRKSSGLVREGTAVKYAAIADWAADKEYSARRDDRAGRGSTCTPARSSATPWPIVPTRPVAGDADAARDELGPDRCRGGEVLRGPPGLPRYHT
jgi:hypothetical protein